MKECTRKAVEAILAADETVSAEDSRKVVSVMCGVAGEESAPDHALTRSEAASLLRISKVTLTRWAMMGVVKRLSIPGRRKAVGYSRESVYAILRGDVNDGTASPASYSAPSTGFVRGEAVAEGETASKKLNSKRGRARREAVPVPASGASAGKGARE